MQFTEFLKEEEDLDLLADAILEEGVVGGTLRALGGFGGNLLTQTGRGVYNIAAGTGQAARGVGRVGLGAVQGATGGFRQAGSSLASGARDIASGVDNAATGFWQTAGALSGVTPTFRAVQAANEKSFFTPMSNRRTGIQKAMGLNSWDPEGDAKKDAAEQFQALKTQYVQARKAGNGDLARKIRAKMEKSHPEEFKALVAKANSLKAAKEKERWAQIASRVKPQESPSSFLGRL